MSSQYLRGGGPPYLFSAIYRQLSQLALSKTAHEEGRLLVQEAVVLQECRARLAQYY